MTLVMATRKHSSRSKPRRLELYLSAACGQRCVSCAQSEWMESVKACPLSAGEVSTLLIKRRREGFTHLTLTGGEPTQYPRFAEVLGEAKRLGYRTFVASNGALLAEEPFAERVLPLIDELCLSVHADDALTHDAYAGKEGSFAAVTAALAHTARHAPRLVLLTETVVTTLNAGHIRRLLEWLISEHAVRRCLLSNLAPEGRALVAYERLCLPLERWRAMIPGLVELAEGSDVALRFFGLPLCAFGDRASLSSDLYWSPRASVRRRADARGAGLAEAVELEPRRGRIQPEACRPCAVRRLCGGVFDAYVDKFGTADLEPLKKTIRAG